MKVSILITTYNLEKYIRKTMDTVLNQDTEYDFEVLVGDDGSSDKTVDIVKEYIDKYPDRIRLFQMSRDEKTVYNRVERSASNRINLLKNAKGEYISFLDGDDFYLSSIRIEKMVKILEKSENQDCVMCAHNLLMYYESQKDSQNDGNHSNHDLDNIYPENIEALGENLCRAQCEHKWEVKDYWPAIFLQANAILFRNVFKNENVFNDFISNSALCRNFDDNNITFFLFMYGKMYYIPETLGAYRQVEGSSWNGIDELKKHCSNMIGYSLEKEIAPDMLKYCNARHYQDFSYIYEHRAELSEDGCMPFYKTAKECNLQTALDIYNMKTMNEDFVRDFEKLVKSSKSELFKYKRKRALLKLMKKY